MKSKLGPALAFVLLCSVSFMYAQVATDADKAAKDTGHATKVAAKDTAHGTDKAAKKTGHGLKTGAKGVGKGIKKGADKTADAVK